MATLFDGPEADVKGIERLAREADPLLEKRQAEYLSLEVRSILNRCSSERMPFTWTINPYRGCEFGCRYCYARYTHEFMGLNRWEDFEEKIYVKRDVVRLLARELTPERLRGQSIALGTATDPYQPAERRYRVTRSLLEVMAMAQDLHLSITTKGDLIVRDLDLLRKIDARNHLSVNFTVTTLDRRLARILEFRAPTPDLRLKALRTLREVGIAAGISLAPILPDLTDSRANLDAVIAAARAHDATHVHANVLFLKPSAQQAFFPFLEKHFPHLRKRYAARFARSAFLDRAYKERIFRLVAELKQQHGLPDHRESESPIPLHETEAAQLPLLQIESPTRSVPHTGAPPQSQSDPRPISLGRSVGRYRRPSAAAMEVGRMRTGGEPASAPHAPGPLTGNHPFDPLKLASSLRNATPSTNSGASCDLRPSSAIPATAPQAVLAGPPQQPKLLDRLRPQP